MIWVRKFFGLLLLSVAAVLVASIVVTFSQLLAYFSLLYTCLFSEPCDYERFKDIFFGVITYLFMAFMVYYFSRKGFMLFIASTPEEDEPNSILDESDFSHTQENLNYFQTRYGYCHVLPDKIVFSNSKTADDNATYTEKKKTVLLQVIQVLVSCIMIYYLYILFLAEDYQRMSVPVIVLLMSGISLATSFRNSTAKMILREKILSVSFVKGIPYLIIPHFVIWFSDEKNRKRKRVIILSENSGKKVSEALLVMRKASLIKD